MLTLKDIKIDTDMLICYQNDNEVKLNKSEYSVLAYLIENANKVHTRREISEAIWNEYDDSVRKIDAIVSRLRKKLNDKGQYIVTRPGFGYGVKSN